MRTLSASVTFSTLGPVRFNRRQPLSSMSTETTSNARTRQAIAVDQHAPEPATGLVQATSNASAPSDRQRKQAAKVTKKTVTKSRNARQSSATVSNAAGDEQATFRLSRVQKIVKMDSQSLNTNQALLADMVSQTTRLRFPGTLFICSLSPLYALLPILPGSMVTE